MNIMYQEQKIRDKRKEKSVKFNGGKRYEKIL